MCRHWNRPLYSVILLHITLNNPPISLPTTFIGTTATNVVPMKTVDSEDCGSWEARTLILERGAAFQLYKCHLLSCCEHHKWNSTYLCCLPKSLFIVSWVNPHLLIYINHKLCSPANIPFITNYTSQLHALAIKLTHQKWSGTLTPCSSLCNCHVLWSSLGDVSVSR